MARDALDPFDDDTVAAVAAEHGVSRGALEDAAARHQAAVREHREVGGTDGLVYEWRRAFRYEPLAGRTPAVYYLAVDADVWRDFADRLDLDGATFDALRALHRRQFRADRGDPAPAGREAMLLVR